MVTRYGLLFLHSSYSLQKKVNHRYGIPITQLFKWVVNRRYGIPITQLRSCFSALSNKWKYVGLEMNKLRCPTTLASELCILLLACSNGLELATQFIDNSRMQLSWSWHLYDFSFTVVIRRVVRRSYQKLNNIIF